MFGDIPVQYMAVVQRTRYSYEYFQVGNTIPYDGPLTGNIVLHGIDKTHASIGTPKCKPCSSTFFEFGGFGWSHLL